jgi:lipoate-protein ligase A
VNVVSSAKHEPIPSLTIRHIPYHVYTGQINMALDHYFASTFDQAKSALIRFYGWYPFCLSLGYHQSADYIQRQHLTAAGYDIVRRPTGGKAILHAEELTYSVIFGLDYMQPREMYEYVHALLARALDALNFNVTLQQLPTRLPSPKSMVEDFLCFTHSAYSEIQYRGKKLVGSAQRIYPKCILQQGSLLLGPTHTQVTEFINCDDYEKERMTEEINQISITLEQINPFNINKEKIIDSIIKQLELSTTISLNFEDITEMERKAVQEFIIPL